jgi:hypothetical protein
VARFLAEVEGRSNPVHRLGTPSSGIRAQAQGWDVGVKVYGSADGDADVFQIYATGGSNGHASPVLVGTVRLDDDGQPEFVPVTPFD